MMNELRYRSPSSRPPVVQSYPRQPQYPPTEIQVSGEYTEKRVPELADVTLTIKVVGWDKAAVLKEFKASANTVVEAVAALAPPKRAVAGALVDAEWPVQNPSKPVVRWSTGRLSTRSWEETESSETTSTTAGGGLAFVSTVVTTVDKVQYRTRRKYQSSQAVTATFHDFAALETFVTGITARKNVEFDSIGWRISTQTRKALEAAVIAGAVLDARSTALKLIAPLSDEEPRLRALEIVNGGAAVVQHYAAASSRRAYDSSNGREEDEPKINFEPEPISHQHNVSIKWVVEE
ncbi:hypothetical protein Q8F55_009303 [Vanrija albida]|uniref:SIMPL domain-containing protein n=1 Tax=Vanrija albida TaxID=181172 RepID=A0ABR3PTA5_9TREE